MIRLYSGYGSGGAGGGAGCGAIRFEHRRGPVSFDGLAAEVLYSSLFQTNVLVPERVSGKSEIRVGAASVTVPVTGSAPGLFTLNGTRRRPSSGVERG